MLLAGGALCNDASLEPDGAGRFHTVGDPTEGALLVAALLAGGLHRGEAEAIAVAIERRRICSHHQVLDRVLPSAPYRQWTLSVPGRLRPARARDRKLLSAVLT